MARSRPSPDVLVSALCTMETQDDPALNSSQPFIISGVAIRRNMITTEEAASMFGRKADHGSEVFTLNQVNQALTEDLSPHIIDEPVSSHQQESAPNPFVSYLLVHDIRKSCRTGGASKHLISANTNNPALLGSKAFQECYHLPQILEISEEDPLSSVNNITSNSTIANIPIVLATPQATSSTTVTKPKCKPADNGYTLTNLKYNRNGQVTQCIDLPASVTTNQMISCIVPTLDNTYVVVITTPKEDLTTVSADDVAESSEVEGACSSNSYSDVCGCLLVYQVVNSQTEFVTLKETPVVTYEARDILNTVKSVIFLPRDITNLLDEEEEKVTAVSYGLDLHMAAIMYSGELSIIRLSDLKFLSQISPPEGDKFVSVTFCSGK